MGDIGQWGSQLLNIVNDLQDATKLEAGAIEMQVEDIDGDELSVQSLDSTITIGSIEMVPGDTTFIYSPILNFNRQL